MQIVRTVPLLLVAVAAAGTTVAGAATGTGAHGTVTRSPTTPVCRQGVPCSAPAKLIVLRFTRRAVTHTTRTDAHGRYSIALTPGLYTVSTGAASSPGRGLEPRVVRVRAGVCVLANFNLDTGIR